MRSNQVTPNEFPNLPIPIGTGNVLLRIEFSMNQLDMVVKVTSNEISWHGTDGSELFDKHFDNVVIDKKYKGINTTKEEEIGAWVLIQR